MHRQIFSYCEHSNDYYHCPKLFLSTPIGNTYAMHYVTVSATGSKPRIGSRRPRINWSCYLLLPGWHLPAARLTCLRARVTFRAAAVQSFLLQQQQLYPEIPSIWKRRRPLIRWLLLRLRLANDVHGCWCPSCQTDLRYREHRHRGTVSKSTDAASHETTFNSNTWQRIDQGSDQCSKLAPLPTLLTTLALNPIVIQIHANFFTPKSTIGRSQGWNRTLAKCQKHMHKKNKQTSCQPCQWRMHSNKQILLRHPDAFCYIKSHKCVKNFVRPHQLQRWCEVMCLPQKVWTKPASANRRGVR